MLSHPFIALTDRNWFEFLAARAVAEGGTVDEVNFWQPKALTPMKRLPAGTPVFFRHHAPTKAIAGYGFFANFAVLSLRQTWEYFGTGNGDPDFASFLTRLGNRRGENLFAPSATEQVRIGCFILRDAVFWPRERWIPWGEAEGWAKTGIQKGKAEADPVRAQRLIDEIRFDAHQTPDDLRLEDFRLLDADEREVQIARTRPRVGQGTFRSRLLDSYGRRCAITGEHTEIVLDAAHIQPYLGPRSNHVQNGLLLTKEFHALFDAGYVTVTPEYEVRVSRRLKDEWDNGHRYYPVDGERLAVLPKPTDARPSAEALEWHGAKVFRG